MAYIADLAGIGRVHCQMAEADVADLAPFADQVARVGVLVADLARLARIARVSALVSVLDAFGGLLSIAEEPVRYRAGIAEMSRAPVRGA